MTLSEVLLLLTLLWDVMKGAFDIVMKLSTKNMTTTKKIDHLRRLPSTRVNLF